MEESSSICDLIDDKPYMEALIAALNKLNERMDRWESKTDSSSRSAPQPKSRGVVRDLASEFEGYDSEEVKCKPSRRHKVFCSLCFSFDHSESTCNVPHIVPEIIPEFTIGDDDGVMEPIKVDEVVDSEFDEDTEDDLPIRIISPFMIHSAFKVFEDEIDSEKPLEVDLIEGELIRSDVGDKLNSIGELESTCEKVDICEELIESEVVTVEKERSNKLMEIELLDFKSEVVCSNDENDFSNVEVVEFVIVEDEKPLTLSSILNQRQAEVQSTIYASVLLNAKDQHSRSNVFEGRGNDAGQAKEGYAGMGCNIPYVLNLQRVKKLKWNSRKPWRSKQENIGFKRRLEDGD